VISAWNLSEEADMKSKRFSEEQIIGFLKQVQTAMKVVDLCRMHGIKGSTVAEPNPQ